MSQTYQDIRQKRYTDRDDTILDADRDSSVRSANLVANIQNFVTIFTSALVIVLALRGIMAVLQANTQSGFVSLINTITNPFVAPFSGLFDYDTSVFQVYTLIAMIVYALIGWVIVRLLDMGNDNVYAE